MSWRTFLLGAGLLAGSTTATEADAEWFSPVAGFLKVYGLSDDADLLSEPVHAAVHSRHHLMLLSEMSVDKRVHVDGATNVSAEAKGKQAGLGHQGTDAHVMFAGTTASAAQRALSNASSGNALVSNLKVATADKLQGQAEKKVTPLHALGWFAWLRVTLSAGFILKSLCMVSNVFYQSSPLPIISDFKTKGDTGDADLAPFIATAYSGWQWCYYGFFAYIVTGKSGFLVLVYSNVVGATFGLYYVYGFLACCKNQVQLDRRNLYYYVIGCVAGVQLVALLTQEPVRALFFSGLVSSAWATITSSSLLATVPIVYQTKSSKSLPLPLLVMGAVSSALWLACGLMLWDPWITFPNIYALGVCTFACYLCYIFPAHDSSSCEASAKCDIEPIDAEEGEPLLKKSVEELRKNASPLQRALGQLLGESDTLSEVASSSMMYGGTGECGTGGTGDSF